MICRSAWLLVSTYCRRGGGIKTYAWQTFRNQQWTILGIQWTLDGQFAGCCCRDKGSGKYVADLIDNYIFTVDGSFITCCRHDQQLSDKNAFALIE